MHEDHSERITAAEIKLTWHDADIAELKRGLIMLEKSNLDLNRAISNIHNSLNIIKWCAITGVTVYSGQSLGIVETLLMAVLP